MKKIVIMTGGLGGGGAEKVCVTIANGLSCIGWDVEVVTLNLKNDVYSAKLSKSIKLKNLEIGNVRFAFFSYVRYCIKNRPAVILSFNYQISVLLIAIRCLLRMKFRLISRNINLLSELEMHQTDIWNKAIVNPIVRRIYPRSDIIVAQSVDMKTDLISFLGVAPDKVKVIYNPIGSDIENYMSNKSIRNGRDGHYILCVGRLEPQKDFESAIIAFFEISKKFSEIKLVIAGKGSQEAELKDMVKRLDLNDRVEFLGFTNELIPFYLGAKFTLLTSVYEGFPNVLVESIALGVPVVAFDCPSGPREIIRQGVNGLLVEERSLKSLALAMEQAINNEWNQFEILNTSRQYSSSYVLKEYIEVLEV